MVPSAACDDRVNMPAVTVEPGSSVLPFQRIDSFK